MKTSTFNLMVLAGGLLCLLGATAVGEPTRAEQGEESQPELLSLPALRDTQTGDAERTNDVGSDKQVSLEGGWQAYQSTPYTVKRFINIERDGKSYQAEVYTPVLIRRGSILLDPEKIKELLAIQEELGQLAEVTTSLIKRSGELEARYTTLIEEAESVMPVSLNIYEHGGRVNIDNYAN